MSTATLATIRVSLEAVIPPALVTELLATYVEAKENFYLGGLRLSAVEGGRFAEAAFRVLEHEAFGRFTPIGSSLDTDGTIRRLSNTAPGSLHDSVRLHIPRALRVVYDIRNNRDAAHLADGIDPNLQDATLVIGVLDWVMAEFVRLHHGVDARAAQGIVEDLVARQAPVIQDFDGYLKILRTDLSARERVLVLLYQRGSTGATPQELRSWVDPSMRKNLPRTLSALVVDKAWVHESGGRLTITRSGRQEVDSQGWLRP